MNNVEENDNKNKKLSCKHAFRIELKMIDDMKNIHQNVVKDIVEWSLLQGIMNTSTCTKSTNYHYSTILHGYMNTYIRRDKKSSNFVRYWM